MENSSIDDVELVLMDFVSSVVDVSLGDFLL